MSKDDDDDFWLSASRRQALESSRQREQEMFAEGWRRNIFWFVLLAAAFGIAYLVLG